VNGWAFDFHSQQPWKKLPSSTAPKIYNKVNIN
jgi:hypothetical protein